jgi:UDP-N-acetylglucosamine 2-epimerase (non-hydrolysing)
MKFWFCLGTAAELIKIFPIINEAQNRNIEWYVIATGQSGINFYKQYDDFQLPHANLIKFQITSKDLSNSQSALSWFFKSLLISKKRILNNIKTQIGIVPQQFDFWYIHGDTLSTLIGSIYGKRLSLQIVHIEAGMRSHHMFSPFPEEICRRIVSRLATFHMVPDQNAFNNLSREGIIKNVFVTHGNTVMDALNVCIDKFIPVDLPEGKYAIANFHRFENLNSEIRWNKIIETLLTASAKMHVIFVLMPNTEEKLKNDPALLAKLKQHNIHMVSRLPFSRFVHLMKNSEYMITDGGSNQQECFHLGKPCLILRENSESIEGIGSCCVLSKFDDQIINNFFEDPMRFKAEKNESQASATSYVFTSLQIGN